MLVESSACNKAPWCRWCARQVTQHYKNDTRLLKAPLRTKAPQVPMSYEPGVLAEQGLRRCWFNHSRVRTKASLVLMVCEIGAYKGLAGADAVQGKGPKLVQASVCTKASLVLMAC